MAFHRIPAIRPQLLALPSKVGTCSPKMAFVALPIGAAGTVAGGVAEVYQAAYDAARRQLSQRALRETWNWRNN